MITVRELSREDTRLATELGRRAFDAAPEQPDLADELGRSIARTWVAYDGDRLVGYVLGWVASDEAQLMSIAVEHGARGRGIGKALLARLLRELTDEGITSVVLEVRASNTAARSLYESLAFEVLGGRRAYYADGEDAVTYRRTL